MMPDSRRANEGGTMLRSRYVPVSAGVGLAMLTGLLMPVQARINGGLSDRSDDPVLAALVSFTVGLLVMAVTSAVLPAGRRGLRALGPAIRGNRFPFWYLFAGMVGAFSVLSQTITVGVIGVALFTVAFVAGRTVSGLIIDHTGFGAIGARPLNMPRLLGGWLALMAVLWAVSPEVEQGVSLTMIMCSISLPFTAGFLVSYQQAMNGSAAIGYGTPLAATLVNFAAGSAVLLAVWLIKLALAGTGQPLPAEPWYYAGGALGCIFVGLAAVLVRYTGVLLLGLGLVAGQLFGSLLMDVLFPVENAHVDFAAVAGALMTLAAVIIAALPWTTRPRGQNRVPPRMAGSLGKPRL